MSAWLINLAQHNLDKANNCLQGNFKKKIGLPLGKNIFHPVKIGEKIVIKPSWESYQPLPEELIIELDPGMAFGAEAPTIRPCCAVGHWKKVMTPGQVVFDVGTGSGILAVAAAKLGAASVRAVDLDSVAVRVAKENVVMNHVEDRVEVREGDLLTGFSGQADVVVANIIADVIIYACRISQAFAHLKGYVYRQRYYLGTFA